MVDPHGGKLVNRLVQGAEKRALLAEAERALSVRLSPWEISDLEMIAIGGFSPLTGFMGQEDLRSVLSRKRLASGLPWTLPINLSTSPEMAAKMGTGDLVALRGREGELLAVLRLSEKYSYDKEELARTVYLTTEDAHPGVAAIRQMGDILLAGEVTVLERPRHDDFPQYRLDPADTRRAFAERDWRTIVGFQTRNPVHRAHEYIQKCAMEIVDGLLLHPIVGETKSDDVPVEVRMRCYEVLLETYYPKGRAMLVVNPCAMRYGGPREAIFHAIVRKNYGCTHFIVGRDHAGVGSYYGPYDAQYIFREFDEGELGITPLFFENAFYCRRCGNMASPKTCPHGEADRLSLSGTAVRQMLSRGEVPPPEFSRPEVARVLIEAMTRKSAPTR